VEGKRGKKKKDEMGGLGLGLRLACLCKKEYRYSSTSTRWRRDETRRKRLGGWREGKGDGLHDLIDHKVEESDVNCAKSLPH